MTKRLIILNAILLFIILLDKPIVSLFCDNTAISFDPTKNISGFGKVDRFNNKQGEWCFRDSVGNIFLIGNYKDNKKEGEWLCYDTNNELIKTHFKSDTLWGAYKSFDDAGNLSEVVFCNGDNYYGIVFCDKYAVGVIDWVSQDDQDDHYKEYHLARKIYNTEYGNQNDDPFNHKENGYDTLSWVINRLDYFFDSNPLFKHEVSFIFKDNFVYILNRFEVIISIINNILMIIMVVGDVLFLILKK